MKRTASLGRTRSFFQKAHLEAPLRRPVRVAGKQGEVLRRRFSREHVFISRDNTPLTESALLYAALVRHCNAAGIESRRLDADGREIDHVDVHSLRRTFATELIVNGADPKTVQELLGHRSLAITTNLYVEVHGRTKRHAPSCLSYGAGASPPEHLIPLPGAKPGQKMVTIAERAKPDEAQVSAG